MWIHMVVVPSGKVSSTHDLPPWTDSSLFRLYGHCEQGAEREVRDAREQRAKAYRRSALGKGL